MPNRTYNVELLNRVELTPGTFEVNFSRPADFAFEPGQRVRLAEKAVERDYSLASSPDDPHLTLCIRAIRGGRLSNRICSATTGTRFFAVGPEGYFLFRPSPRPPVFVATGTGIAPFVSMARSGIRGFTLLHGVRDPDQTYYAALWRQTAARYVACISGSAAASPPETFKGRVGDYLMKDLAPGAYDFYLCGRREMVRDVTWIVDDRFEGSLVYTEIFF
jgi:ferredoxin-NADP reductase